jgi:hypothetical protein
MGADPTSLADMVRIRNGFRPGTWDGGYVIVHCRRDATWTLARLTTDSARPFDYLDGQVHGSEHEARAAVARLTARPIAPDPPPRGRS